jgi:hypothetical protein
MSKGSGVWRRCAEVICMSGLNRKVGGGVGGKR